MISELDDSILELLRRTLPQAIVEGVSFSLTAPDDLGTSQADSFPMINLFLYDIRERRDLRTCERESRMAKDGVVAAPPPVRVDCSYLITAWQNPGATAPVRDEHRLLSEVMAVLLRHPTLPEAVLQGRLADATLPLPTAVLQPGPQQNDGDVWRVLGGKPKAALHYTVTLAVSVEDPYRAGESVTSIHLDFGTRAA